MQRAIGRSSGSSSLTSFDESGDGLGGQKFTWTLYINKSVNVPSRAEITFKKRNMGHT